MSLSSQTEAETPASGPGSPARIGTGTYIYPWDIVGDPLAAGLVADLGVDRVSVAAAYHSVRALTPRHPEHRYVSAVHPALYVPFEPQEWAGQRLAPVTPSWAPGPGSFAPAAQELRSAGLDVFAWVVLLHDARLATANPELAVRNAFGDLYPWALCAAAPDVVDYAARIAATCAAQPGLAGIELESCGWFGLAHLSAHDKVAGVSLSDGETLLASLCFCDACTAAYQEAGLDVAALRADVRSALDARFAGGPSDPGPALDVLARAVGDDVATAVMGCRDAAAARLRARVVTAVREVAPQLTVLLHADPRPWQTGAFAGVDPAAALIDVDGLVVASPPPAPGELVAQVAAVAGRDARIVANMPAVAGLGGGPDTLASRVRDAVAAGATDIHLYHAGLASAADLALARRVVAETAALHPRTGALS